MQDDNHAESPTLLIQAAIGGDAAARDRVFHVLRHEIHEIAESLTRGQERQVTLEAGMLVSELWIKVRSAFPAAEAPDPSTGEGEWNDRQAFLRYATRAMRNMLVDGARRRIAARRGGNHRIHSLSSEVLCDEPMDQGSTPEAVLFADELAEKLESEHPEHAELLARVRFSGLTPVAAGRSLGMTEARTEAAWTLVRGLVIREWSQ